MTKHFKVCKYLIKVQNVILLDNSIEFDQEWLEKNYDNIELLEEFNNNSRITDWIDPIVEVAITKKNYKILEWICYTVFRLFQAQKMFKFFTELCLD